MWSCKDLMSKFVKQKLTGLDELSLLWHIGNSLELFLDKKVKYEVNKIEVKSMIFNPYAEYDETTPNTTENNNNTTQHEMAA